MQKKRIYLLAAVILALALLPAAHAASGALGAIETTFGQLNAFLNNEWIIYGMVFVLLFILFYAIFAAALARVKIFEGEHGLSKQGKIFGIALSALTNLSIFYFTVPPGPQEVLKRILPMFGIFGGLAFGLIIFSIVFFGFGEATGGKNWKLALFSAGFGMILAGMLLQSPVLSAWGWILALVGGIGMLIGAFGGGGGDRGDHATHVTDGHEAPPGPERGEGREGTVNVEVVDSGTHAPVQHARVRLLRRASNLGGRALHWNRWIDFGNVDNNGHLTFHCRPGRRYVEVTAPGYQPSGRAGFHLRPSAAYRLVIPLTPAGGGGGGGGGPGTIFGQVTNAAGEGLNGVTVTAAVPGQPALPPMITQTAGGNDGMYQIVNAPINPNYNVAADGRVVGYNNAAANVAVPNATPVRHDIGLPRLVAGAAGTPRYRIRRTPNLVLGAPVTIQVASLGAGNICSFYANPRNQVDIFRTGVPATPVQVVPAAVVNAAIAAATRPPTFVVNAFNVTFPFNPAGGIPAGARFRFRLYVDAR